MMCLPIWGFFKTAGYSIDKAYRTLWKIILRSVELGLRGVFLLLTIQFYILDLDLLPVGDDVEMVVYMERINDELVPGR